MENLDGKVAIVTGAARGLGRAYAVHLAKHGARVVAGDVRDCNETANEIEQAGGEALAVHLDVGETASCEAMAAATLGRFGRIDALVNNAGVMPLSRLQSGAVDDWDRMIDIHVKGTFLCCQGTLARMRTQGTGGAIVTMSSDFAVMAIPNGAAYCAAKAAIFSLTKSIAQEFAPDRVRINALGPGPIDTPILRSGRSDAEYQAVRDAFADKLPIGRLGQPEEVAYAMLFLACDESSFITGADLVVDGGFTAR